MTAQRVRRHHPPVAARAATLHFEAQGLNGCMIAGELEEVVPALGVRRCDCRVAEGHSKELACFGAYQMRQANRAITELSLGIGLPQEIAGAALEVLEQKRDEFALPVHLVVVSGPANEGAMQRQAHQRHQKGNGDRNESENKVDVLAMADLAYENGTAYH